MPSTYSGDPTNYNDLVRCPFYSGGLAKLTGDLVLSLQTANPYLRLTVQRPLYRTGEATVWLWILMAIMRYKAAL